MNTHTYSTTRSQHKLLYIVALSTLVLAVLLFPARFVQAQQPVVRAVLFYSPTCSHCHEVMENDLPPLVQKYPGQLDIVGIDVTHTVGQNIYQAALVQYAVPDDRIGVPTLIVGETVLVGSEEIPAKFPGIIEQGLAGGGIDWPQIPGLAAVMATAGNATPLASAKPQSEPGSSGEPGFVSKFMQDPLANTIAVIVLVLMIILLISSTAAFLRGSKASFISLPDWLIPLLALAGLGVALYMSYVELFQAEAVCGPVGNCNSVQQSPYAYLFGFLPVGVLGVVGYLFILVAWLLKKLGGPTLRRSATLIIWVLSWFGVAFSIYLTFLEPFIIGATCVWCITSALIMSLLLLTATKPALQSLALDDLDDDDEDDEDEDEN